MRLIDRLLGCKPDNGSESARERRLERQLAQQRARVERLNRQLAEHPEDEVFIRLRDALLRDV